MRGGPPQHATGENLRHDPLRDPKPLIGRVYAYAAYRLGDGADAEDVTSETFERALRYRQSFDPRRGEPLAWLIGIARRCIADATLRTEVPVAELPGERGEGHDDRTVQRLDLHAAVAQLGERDRELIALRYGADLSTHQIAAVLELTGGAVDVALHRALGRLRAALDVSAETKAAVARLSPARSER